MAVDKADWHWDDTEKLYRKTNNVKGTAGRNMAVGVKSYRIIFKVAY